MADVRKLLIAIAVLVVVVAAHGQVPYPAGFWTGGVPFPQTNSLVYFATCEATNASGQLPSFDTLGPPNDGTLVGVYITNDVTMGNSIFSELSGLDYVTVSDDNSLSLSGTFTFSWWQNSLATDTRIFMGKDNGTSGEYLILNNTGSTNRPKLQLFGDGRAGGLINCTMDHEVPGGWTHFAFVVDARNTNNVLAWGYTNGLPTDVTQSATNYPGMNNTATDFYLFTRQTQLDFDYKGWAKYVMIYGTNLTDAQVLNVYNLQKP